MSSKTEIAIEASATSIANKAVWAGGGAGALGAFASINWLGLGGFLLALLGYLTSLYFQSRRDKREAAESAARIEALKDRCKLP